jgi:ribosomal protein L5
MFASKKFDYADIAYNKAADIYLKAKDVNSIEKLADDMRKKGLFTSAEKLYMKSGNTPFAMKCKAFDKILAFQYDSARIFLDQANEPLIAKALKDNTKNIKGMEDIAMNLESISGGQPYVNYLTDSTTGKTYLNSVDEKVLNEYYGMVKDQIVDNIMRLSSLMKLVTNADLREILKAKFQKYAAVGKILDPATYAPKIQKAQVTVKDVYLQ